MNEIYLLSPSIILIFGGMLLLLYGIYGKVINISDISYLSMFLIFIATYHLFNIPYDGSTIYGFKSSIIFNNFILFSQAFILSIGFVLLLMLSTIKPAYVKFEVPILLLFIIAFALILVSSNDLLTLYLSLEAMSLTLYVMVALDSKDDNSTEAALKYFILGALASGLYLFGASLIYGVSSDLSFLELSGYDMSSLGSHLFLIGVLLVLAMFCFKVSAAPFHIWVPDVYQGAPSIVTAILSSLPKVVGLLLFIRIITEVFTEVDVDLILKFVSVSSIFIGAFGAIMQKNIKRMLAFSGIMHVGFILLGLVSGSIIGIQSFLIYLVVYSVLILSIFSILLIVNNSSNLNWNINDLSGLGVRSPALAFSLAIFMFSMSGIPPFAGFFAKLYILLALVKQGMYVLAVVSVVGALIGCFYYLRIVKIMYFDGVIEDSVIDRNYSLETIVFFGVCFNLLYVVYPNWLATIAQSALMN